MGDLPDGEGRAAIRVRPTLRKERSPLAAPARQLELLDQVDLAPAPGRGDFGALTSEALGGPLRATLDDLGGPLGRTWTRASPRALRGRTR